MIELTFLKELILCHSWDFLNKAFKLQPYVFNGCHDLLMMSMKLSCYFKSERCQLSFYY